MDAFRSHRTDGSARRLTGQDVWLTKALAEVPGNNVSRAIAPGRRPLPLRSRSISSGLCCAVA